MPLIHLIYVSTAREEFDMPELDRRLDTAVRRLGAAGAGASPGYAPFFVRGFAAAIGAKPGLALELLMDFRRARP